MMRAALIAMVLTAGLLVSSDAREQTGTIISIDEANKSFICKWQTNNWTYKTTDKTVFRVGGKTGSWSDLKVNVRVNVGFHMVGNDRVADWVSITK